MALPEFRVHNINTFITLPSPMLLLSYNVEVFEI
jgi:hypothetical protein